MSMHMKSLLTLREEHQNSTYDVWCGRTTEKIRAYYEHVFLMSQCEEDEPERQDYEDEAIALSFLLDERARADSAKINGSLSSSYVIPGITVASHHPESISELGRLAPQGLRSAYAIPGLERSAING
jgi:hypothetical protein